jgi:hypothetical protein
MFVSIGLCFPLSLQAQGQMETRFMSCAQIKSDLERLTCFDKLAEELSAEKTVYVKPPQQFLDSQLRVDPEKSDFDLTIDQFVQLIRSAKMEDGQPVVVNGWSVHPRGYTLSIQMNSSVQLVFVFEPRKNNKVSVLQPVLIKGIETDPEVFVMTMAARTMGLPQDALQLQNQ